MSKLKFHQKTFDLLELAPLPSEANRRDLAAAAKIANVSLPAAVAEWFSLENGAALLRRGADGPSPLSLKAYVASLHTMPPKGKLRLIFLGDSAELCWAVELIDEPDPPVYVRVLDAQGNESWRTTAERFSDFVYCWIWDHPTGGASAQAQVALTLKQIRRLSAIGQELPMSRAWPSHKTFRFQASEGRIRLHYEPGGWSQVALWAGDAQSVVSLVQHASRAGVPRQAFFSDQPKVNRFLSASAPGTGSFR